MDGTPIERVAPARERRGGASSTTSIGGMLWFGGWLFTVGFVKLVWWKVLLALVLWPYFLGTAAR